MNKTNLSHLNYELAILIYISRIENYNLMIMKELLF